MHPHDAHRRAFIKLTESIGRAEGWGQYEVFRTFLEAAYRAIRGAFLIGDAWQANEDEYMKIVARCRHKLETMRGLSEMLGHTVEALEASCRDFLGPVYMDIGGSSDLGQFFTPHEVSKLIAEMNVGDMAAVIAQSERGYFTASEPAAGMGGMVLAVAEIMREKGFNPARHCHWHMVDVEWKAMAGCYIQTSLAGVSGVVVHGNALSLESWSAAATPMAVLYPKRFDVALVPASIEAIPTIADPTPSRVKPARPQRATAQFMFDF